MGKSKKIISGIITISAIIISVAVVLQINLEEGSFRNELDNSWQVSGKFQIDKSEYMLGEKVFINIVELDEDEKVSVELKNSLIYTQCWENTN